MNRHLKINLDKEALVTPFKVVGITASPMQGFESYTLSPSEVNAFTIELAQLNKLSILTNTLQSLSMNAECIPMITAFPSMKDTLAVCQTLTSLPDSLKIALHQWAEAGCDEVNFDFIKALEE